MPIINGPAGFDPALGKMRTVSVVGGTAADYTFNSSEFTIGVAGLVSLKEVPGSKVAGPVPSVSSSFFGGRLIVSGGTATFNPVANIVNATGATVTLVPDTAYKVQAVTSAVTLNANPPAAGQWGLEGHIELFVAGTGYVVTGSNVVLANALEPDAVNNCTVRFHDGYAIISVEDHIAGYIVTVNAASGAGSLAYGLATATNEYISVDASLNGQTLDLAGATTYAGEKHVVGNGYTETVISGGITCTSKTTFSNLSLQNVAVEGGTATLGDVYIPNGATVAVSGGGLAIEKVTGDGGTIDFNGEATNVVYTNALFANVVITGGTSNSREAGFLYINSTPYAFIDSCVISGNKGAFGAILARYNANANKYSVVQNTRFENNSAWANRGGGFGVMGGNNMTVKNCVFEENVPHAFYVNGENSWVAVEGSTFGERQGILFAEGGTVSFAGTNHFLGKVDDYGSGKFYLESGAVLDLTGNTNPTPIAPGGGITFESGGATVLYSSGTVSGSYSMDNVTLPAGVKLTNTAVVDGGGVEWPLMYGEAVSVSGATITNAKNPLKLGAATCNIENVVFTSNSASSDNEPSCINNYAGTVNLKNCSFVGNPNAYRGVIFADGNGVYTLEGCEFDATGMVRFRLGGTVVLTGTNKFLSNITGFNGGTGTVTISSGAVIDLTGNTLSTVIVPGGGIVVSGSCTVINSAGASVSIAGGTYTKINNDGTTE